MKKYKTLIIDLDDTLVSKSASIFYAYKELMNMEILDLPYDQKEAEKFLEFDTNFWKEHERNGWQVPPEFCSSKEDRVYYLRTERFIRYFDDVLKITSNLPRAIAAEMNEVYMNALGKYAEEVPDAENFLKKLPKDTFVIVATNGGQEAAKNRLKMVGLDSYINLVVSSELIGYSKPSREFFDYIFRTNPQLKKEETLVVGDDLITDIRGAKNYGLDSCWFNYENIEVPEVQEFTYNADWIEEILMAFNFGEEYYGGNALKDYNHFRDSVKKLKRR